MKSYSVVDCKLLFLEFLKWDKTPKLNCDRYPKPKQILLFYIFLLYEFKQPFPKPIKLRRAKIKRVKLVLSVEMYYLSKWGKLINAYVYYITCNYTLIKLIRVHICARCNTNYLNLHILLIFLQYKLLFL